jgi:uncharacterized membrane protein YgaE (UPF0421/DUF939 family)
MYAAGSRRGQRSFKLAPAARLAAPAAMPLLHATFIVAMICTIVALDSAAANYIDAAIQFFVLPFLL